MVKTFLSSNHPGMYRQAVLQKQNMRSAIARMRSAQVRRVLLRGGVVQITISDAMGMGGILLNAGAALATEKSTPANVELSFTSPNYRPRGVTGDWLDHYFKRAKPATKSVGAKIPSLHIPDEFRLDVAEAAELVWAYLSISDSLIERARIIRTRERYASVHFRGGDKYLENTRVSAESILNRIELEMQERDLESVFIASDEQDFVDQARARLAKYDVWYLPTDAVSKNGVPAHFQNVPGEIKAYESLVTMLLLSWSEVCVRTPSYLSAWSETLAGPGSTFVIVTS